MEQMKAIRYYAPGDVRIEMVEVPEPGQDEIRIRIDACAVCGTDLKAYASGNPRIKAPRIMGHEFTGIVDIPGKNVNGFEIGDRVVMATSISCGDCGYCRKGFKNLCMNLAPMGFTYDGGMAEYTVIPARALEQGHVIKVPPDVKAEHAALAEPLSCAVNCCLSCGIEAGQTVVIIGAGPMGIMNGIVARRFGADKIILAETNEERLELARDFEFDLLVNPETEDLTKIVKEQTEGLGADVILVAAPAVEPQQQAIEIVRKRGTVCLFASLPAGGSMLSVDSRLIHYGEIRLTGTSDSTPNHVEKAVKIISGNKSEAEKVASHILGLDEIMQGYELMKSGKALRVILKP
ncbi:MAG: alcohol dehydrogenase catalytic domain-containing protein [Planctomycetota bacterium]|jgi:L-iditol 2-dehydrogenase